MFFIGWGEDYHHPHNLASPYAAAGGTFSAWQSFSDDLKAETDGLITECLTLLGEAAQVCYEGLQTTAMENAIDIFMVQPVGRHYEQLWIEGYNNNPAYQGNWFYPLSKWLLG
ncbi:MAG: hypothetical protein QGG34_00370 [SAR202 cluster bacterium]|nr:hypothetical protein [SAR202 cluster bacterium]MDP7103530.1 hypothetical protein [SAR202 cluster bacterium]